MERTSIISTNIKSVGYDKESLLLEVEFTSGEVYRYFDIPEHLYQTFLHASSHEEFLNNNIKFNYRYQKIS